ncbi:putative pentatricopeptide repeat-containing protein At1g10330 [Arachis stenosperma]|uniref:putative pentatricopeptide repeat-containing protein At1g10330 n=1 Tax=Arachis stenosperma TaxID=217475 RepID=UPI0025AC6E8D|nr:putative pentatricopeptide repeat-containing protein At1g10330 [Arachis stenosperma]
MSHSHESLLQLAQFCIKKPKQIKQIHSILITNGYLLHNPNAPSSLKWKRTQIFNALIRGYHCGGFTHKAIVLFTHMLGNQASPNSHTFPPILKAATAATFPPHLGTALHSQAYKRGILSDPFIGTTLVALYARKNDIAGARKVFDEMLQPGLVACNAMLNALCTNGDTETALWLFDSMPNRDVVSWTTIVNGFALNGKFGAAINFFAKMMRHRDVLYCLVKPNEATYVSVISSCANLDGKPALDFGKQVHGYLVVNGSLGVFVGTSLIDLYGKMGCLNYSINVFKVMISKEVCTWNAMISSLASNGREKVALEMFDKMKMEGLKPNSITLVAVLIACARGKFVREGLELFRSMSDDFKVEPVMEHYGCVIDLLGRAGHLQEAADIIRNMPFEPDASVLGAFLGACRIHGAIELGEEIGRKLLKLQTQHCGQYVLLSSINAEKGRWSHAFDLRKEITEAGIQKIPAYSMVDLT